MQKNTKTSVDQCCFIGSVLDRHTAAQQNFVQRPSSNIKPEINSREEITAARTLSRESGTTSKSLIVAAKECRSVNLESPEITKMNPSETRNRETTAVPLEIISSSLQHSQHTITAAELHAIDTLIAFQKGISSILRKE